MGGAYDGRADAVVALAGLIMAMETVWDQCPDAGNDLTATFGKADAASPQHAMAKVPGQAEFCLDLRSDQTATLEAVNAAFLEQIARIETAGPGIRFDLGAQSRAMSASLSARSVSSTSHPLRSIIHAAMVSSSAGPPRNRSRVNSFNSFRPK